MKLRYFLIEPKCLNEAILLKPTLILQPTNLDEDDEDYIDKQESKRKVKNWSIEKLETGRLAVVICWAAKISHGTILICCRLQDWHINGSTSLCTAWN